MRRQSSIESKVLASIGGDPLFGHKSFQTNHFWVFAKKNNGAGSFLTSFLCLPCLPSPSRFRHHTDYAPFSAHLSFSLTLTFLTYSQLPSCCHAAHPQPPKSAFLQRSSRSGSSQNCFAKSILSISAQYLYSLVWFFGFQASCLFGRSNFSFFRVLPQPYVPPPPKENHASRADSR